MAIRIELGEEMQEDRARQEFLEDLELYLRSKDRIYAEIFYEAVADLK